MEAPSSVTLLKPRLRLLRRSPSPRMPDNGEDNTPRSGPSGFDHPANSADEDEQPTPRMPMKAIASGNGDPGPSHPTYSSPLTTATPADTPAARLRALLARAPRSPRSVPPVIAQVLPSDADSDLGSSRLGSSAASVARENLKDIFTRALREPGDTPQKGRPRRNSVDNSLMEISPVLEREKAKHKKKRCSLSDEEVDKRKFVIESDTSVRSSQAATFDTLRARLTSSQSQIMDQQLPTFLYDQSDMPSAHQSSPGPGPGPASMVTTTSSRLDPSLGTPPVATSTPQHSFQFPSKWTYRPNLLEPDSGMQQAIGEIMSSENEASNAADPTTTPATSRPLASMTRGKHVTGIRSGNDSHELKLDRCTVEGNGKDYRRSREDERNNQRERDWNRPKPLVLARTGTPDLPHRLSQELGSPRHAKSPSHELATSGGSSPRPMHGRLQRRGSIASLASFDDDRASRPSSTSSFTDYRERISDLERERKYDRERDWNKPHPPSRPTSSLSNTPHNHTHLHPPRPLSATPYQTPTLASLQRHSSRSSLRSASPTSSFSSHESVKEQEEEEKREVAHERERNWNSPRPRWGVSKRHGLGSSGSGGSSSPPSGLKHEVSGRLHNLLRATSSLSSVANEPLKSRSQVGPLSNAPGHRHSHSDLSLSSPNPHNEFEEALKNGTSAIKAPASASKFGWHSHRPPLPPVGLNGSPDPRPRHNVTRDARDTSSPTPSSRSSSQMSGALKTSMIPVRSNTKSAPADSYLGHVAMPLHSTLSHSETHVESGGQEDMVLASDEESIMDFLPSHPTRTQINEVDDVDTVGHVNTGTERETLPSSGSSQYSPSSPSASPSNARYLNVSHLDIPSGIPRSAEILQVSTSALPESFTPPGTPPASYDTRTSSEAIQPFTLSTPPHQASSSSAIHYLRTPSPPHGLPDLPGPPSSSDDDTLELDGTPTELGSTVRTPRPPGAWASTPQQGNSVPLAISPSSESTPVLASTTPLPRVEFDIRTRPETNGTKSGYLTPITRLRANSLPPHTPAPPGAWMATPNQPTIQTAIVDQSQFGTVGRKRNDLRVRFDVSESETSLADDHPSSPISAIKLSNPELPVSTPSAVVVEGEVKGVTPVQIPEVPSTSGITPTPAALDPPSTPNAQGGLLSPKSLRKSPMIRVVDAYGRERHDIESFETLGLHDDNSRADAVQQGRNRSQLILPSTSANANRSLVRIVDAMGREIEEQGEQQSYTSGADPSVVVNDTPLGRAETITRMKEILRDLQDSSDADRSSEETKLNSGYFEELEEASAAARLARDKLAENLEREAAKERQICLNQDALQPPTWINKLLPNAIRGNQGPWSRVLVYGTVVMQLLLILAMWRYAHIEARRLFYTTYYDPLYPELYVLDGSPCLSGVHSLSRPWTILDSWKTVRQEGWGVVGSEVWRALRHVGDQAWEQWGEHPHSHVERPT